MIRKHCEILTTAKPISMSITSHLSQFPFFSPVARTSKSSLLANFKYTTELGQLWPHCLLFPNSPEFIIFFFPFLDLALKQISKSSLTALGPGRFSGSPTSLFPTTDTVHVGLHTVRVLTMFQLSLSVSVCY